MWLIDQIADQHILQAVEHGGFHYLPGAGSPPELSDDRLIPDYTCAGCRPLKNSAYLALERRAPREIRDTEALSARITGSDDRQCFTYYIRNSRLL